jgi:hypothetical protein
MVAYGTIRSQDTVGASTITTATRAPTYLDGVAGDYWLDSTAHVLHGPKTAGAPPPDLYALDPASTLGGASSGNYTLGLKVRFLLTGSVVTALRFYRHSSSTVNSRTLTLYRGSNPVATTTSSGESGTGWKTIPLSAPVVVDVGVDYVTAYHSGGSYYTEVAGTTPPSFSPTQLTIISACYEAGLNYPSTNVAANMGADLVFSVGSLWPTAIKSAPF